MEPAVVILLCLWCFGGGVCATIVWRDQTASGLLERIGGVIFAGVAGGGSLAAIGLLAGAVGGAF